MTSEEETITAFLFKHTGKNKLTFSEMYLTLSIKLKWFTPQEAKNFIKHIMEQKIITKKDDYYIPQINIEKTQVPTGFYPSKKEYKEKEIKKNNEKTDEKELIEKIIKKIIEKSGFKREDIEKQIMTIEKEKNINPEIAAILIGKEKNIQLEEFFKQTEEKIFS